MRIQFLLFLSLILLTNQTKAQNTNTADSLRGGITPERAWWDLKHYELKIQFNPEIKSIAGSNQIRFEVLSEDNRKMQIDLQEPMRIDSVLYADKSVQFQKSKAVHYIEFPQDIQFQKNQVDSITLFFSGSPIEAKNAPWDGGVVWKKDSLGNNFAASAVQGIGASAWWPTKEHSYDKPEEGVDLYYTADEEYTVVGNGKLVSVENIGKDLRTWHWQVKNPISNYNISFNLGKYEAIKDSYAGLNGELELTYYPLAYNKEIAKKHFAQVKDMLEAMEYWFGPYPFYEDGYKLTQAPFVGMEHQSNVAWGNGFQQGYTGNDMTQTGYGMTFDFMIVHESIHEWFGNSLTHEDIADMWLHEGFTTYGEGLYVEYFHGKDAGQAYTRGTRWRIDNKEPLQGKYGIHDQPNSDIYFKGANILLTLRQIINDDTLWRNILQQLQMKFRHNVVDSKTIEQEIASLANINLDSFFEVYLRQSQIPTFEWKVQNKKIKYRYSDVPKEFSMPIKILVNEEEVWLEPTTKWKKNSIGKSINLQVDPNFYVRIQELEK